jgi:dTDP-4-amino-4,6-dideoxygalactose transaminase
VSDTTPIPFVDLKAQYRAIRDDVVPAMMQVVENAAFILGPQVREFEKNFATYVGARHCVGVESGTAALVLALRALEIGEGDEVILPANTYIASALAVSMAGAIPVLVDMDAHYLMDTSQLDAALTARTKAIMPVHLYGQMVSMEPVMAFARRHNLRVIEDACQAHGAREGGRPAGSIGDVGCFSFYPGKNLGAYGDGGAIVTNDPGVEERLRLLRDFGQRKKYEHLIKGDNSRLDTIQAAVLDVKLRSLDEWNAARRRNAAAYDERLTAVGIAPPPCRTPEAHVYHLYVIEVDERERTMTALAERGIATGIHYPVPIHMQPAYAELAGEMGTFPRTERSASRILSLPMYAELTENQIDRVVDALADCVRPVVA